MNAPWQIPDSWFWSEMGQTAAIISGGTPRTGRADFFGGEIPWITPADLSGYRQKTISAGSRTLTQRGLDNCGAQLLPRGTVLFSSRAPIGYVAIAENPLATNQGFKSFILSDGLLPEYTYYYLQHATKLIAGMARGTTFPEISTKSASQIPIPVPPLKEQNRIVAELENQFTKLDAGVALLKRSQLKINRYRRSVLKYAFEGRLISLYDKIGNESGVDHDDGEVLLKRLLIERKILWDGRGNYKEPLSAEISNLPRLRQGWVWASPDQLSSYASHSLAIGPFGSNLKVSDYTTSGVPLVFVRNIRARYFGPKNQVFVTQHKANLLSAHKVSGGDILITKMGDPPGDACLYPVAAEDAVITADCIKLRLSPLLTERKYFVHAINSSVVKEQILDITKGVAQLKVSLSRFRSIGIPLPSLANQTLIVTEVENRLSVLDGLENTVDASLQRATRLRESILEKAFTGRLVPQDPLEGPAFVGMPPIIEREKPNKRSKQRREERGPKIETEAMSLENFIRLHFGNAPFTFEKLSSGFKELSYDELRDEIFQLLKADSVREKPLLTMNFNKTKKAMEFTLEDA